VKSVHDRPPVHAGPSIELSIPPDGLSFDRYLVRLPTVADIEGIAAAFSNAELLEAGNLPPFTHAELAERLPGLPALVASGRLAPLVVVDADGGDVVGGGALHHLDAERAIVEIGYWLYPHARGRGIATQLVRLLSQHAFSLGVQRVVAHVNVGNLNSERVLERAGFTREGVARSMPKPDGRRVDKTVFSLLPGE
jgi:RimJ/RimL family protein N-acetyltransferase